MENGWRVNVENLSKTLSDTEQYVFDAVMVCNG